MTKIVFLLPPSEWKNKWWKIVSEKLTFSFEKPENIAKNATEKDLKCIGKRFEEWIILNKKCIDWKSEDYMKAIERYSWVMYNAIWYDTITEGWKLFFDEKFLILSGMYGLVYPQDIIGNYKLPIETKWLLSFWWDTISKQIQDISPDYVVTLLPLSYQKMIDFNALSSQIIHVNFYTEKNGEFKKMTHWVKKVKWEWVKKICEAQIHDYKSFWWEIIATDRDLEVTIVL